MRLSSNLEAMLYHVKDMLVQGGLNDDEDDA
jgi:hypothetical protein